MKTTSKLIIFIFALLALAVSTYAESSCEQLNTLGNPLLDYFLQQGGAVAFAIIIAAVTAVTTYRSERSKQRRESKIKAYETLIQGIGFVLRAKDKGEEKKAAAQEIYSQASDTFCVWADKAVLTALSEYMRDSTNENKDNLVILRKDYTKLVAAIRKDIGLDKESSVNDIVGTIVFGDAWGEMPVAESVRIPNPLFVEAKDIWQQLNSSTLDDKTGWAKRFHDLEQEQQLLWSIAEQVDSGQCTGSCIDLYNSRVVAWQSSLENFIHDARLVAEQIRLV